MKQHAEDDGKKSLLQSLTVSVVCTRSRRVIDHGTVEEMVGEHMFALEALCGLKAIPEVSVTGVLEWIGRCLEMKIKGLGGDVASIDWPTGKK